MIRALKIQILLVMLVVVSATYALGAGNEPITPVPVQNASFYASANLSARRACGYFADALAPGSLCRFRGTTRHLGKWTFSSAVHDCAFCPGSIYDGREIVSRLMVGVDLSLLTTRRPTLGPTARTPALTSAGWLDQRRDRPLARRTRARCLTCPRFPAARLTG